MIYEFFIVLTNSKARTWKKEIIDPASQRALLHEACMGYLMAGNSQMIRDCGIKKY
jgi:hypothetical protein